MLLLHFSAAVSRLADQSKVLAQRLALMEERLRRAERALDPDAEEQLPPAEEDELVSVLRGRIRARQD